MIISCPPAGSAITPMKMNKVGTYANSTTGQRIPGWTADPLFPLTDLVTNADALTINGPGDIRISAHIEARRSTLSYVQYFWIQVDDVTVGTIQTLGSSYGTGSYVHDFFADVTLTPGPHKVQIWRQSSTAGAASTNRTDEGTWVKIDKPIVDTRTTQKINKSGSQVAAESVYVKVTGFVPDETTPGTISDNSLVIPEAGNWNISGRVITGGSEGDRNIQLKKNGTVLVVGATSGEGGSTTLNAVQNSVACLAGDLITIEFQGNDDFDNSNTIAATTSYIQAVPAL